MRGIQKCHKMSHLVKNVGARFFESGPCSTCQLYSNTRWATSWYIVGISYARASFLSHFEWVACMVHHGRLGLRLCISTIGISTTYCNEPKNYPPKRWMSATTIILPLCSKSMHRWNPPCKGFILSHFGRACCVGQQRLMLHNLTYVPLVYGGTRKICTDFLKVT